MASKNSELQAKAKRLGHLMTEVVMVEASNETQEEALHLINWFLALPQKPPNDPMNLHNTKALILRRRALASERPAQVAEAVKATRGALSELNKSHPGFMDRLEELAFILHFQFFITQDVSDADEAIAILEQGLQDFQDPKIHDRFRTDLHNIRRCQRSLIENKSMPQDARNIMRSFQSNLNVVVNSGVPFRTGESPNADTSSRGPTSAALGSLTAAPSMLLFSEARERFLGSKATDLDALDEAIERGRKLLEENPLGNQGAFVVVLHTCELLTYRFKNSSDVKYIDEAIGLLMEGLGKDETELRNRIQYLYNIQPLISLKFEHGHRDTTDLDKAIDHGRFALATTLIDDVERPEVHLALWKLVAAAVRHFNRPSDREELGALTHERYEKQLGDPIDNSIKLASVYLMKRFFGEDGALDKAIEVLQGASAIMPDDHRQRAELWNCLGEVLQSRYGHHNTKSDIHDSIELGEKVLAATLPTDPNSNGVERERGLRMLKQAYIRLFQRTHEEEHRMMADRYGNEAREISSYDRTPDWSTMRTRMVTEALSGSRLSDNLDESIEALKDSKDSTDKNNIIYANILNALAHRLEDRFLRSGVHSDLEDAIDIARQATETSDEDGEGFGTKLLYLGKLLLRQCKSPGCTRPGHEGVAAEAMDTLLVALQCEGPVKAITRARAGFELLKSPAILHPDYKAGAFGVARTTIDLIPEIASLPQRPDDKMYVLSRTAADAAANAAAVALECGQSAATALQLLEIGRSVVAGSVYDWQIDLVALKSHDSELAEEFQDISRKLSFKPSEYFTSDERHEASRKMLQLQQKIRRVPGFERFRLAMTEGEQCATAGKDTIVVVNSSIHRSDAIVVQSSGVEFIPLERVTMQIISSFMHLEHGTHSINKNNDVLEWLWDDVVEPILGSLGFQKTPTQVIEAWPRVWWIPTGLLSFFPLHAAGYHVKGDGQCTLDRVVSSYSASVKTIFNTRKQKPQHARSGNVVLSCVASPEDHMPLEHADTEINAVRTTCVAAGLCPVQPDPVRAKTLEALVDCDAFHFAGHGATAQNPLQSFLCLQDWKKGRLTVGDLLEMQASKGSLFLAYLSACSTGRITDSTYNDESLHLANAFQVAGFRHVIGTMWEVYDLVCVEVAELVYGRIGKGGLVEGNDVSVRCGLHHATRTLRDRWVVKERASQLAKDKSQGGHEGVPKGEDEAQQNKAIMGNQPDLGKGRPVPIGSVEVQTTWMPSWVPYVHYGV